MVSTQIEKNRENGTITFLDNAITSNLDLVSNRPYRLNRLLQNVFSSNREFMNLANEVLDNHDVVIDSSYHPNDSELFGCRGFERYIIDAFEEVGSVRYNSLSEDTFDAIIKVLFKRISHQLGYLEDNSGDNTQTMTIEYSSPSIDNIEPSVGRKMVIGDKVYDLKLEESEENSIQEIREQIKENYLKSYKRRLESQKESFKERIQNLREKIGSEKENGFNEGVNFMLEHNDWELRDNGSKLYYTKPIIPDKIYLGDSEPRHLKNPVDENGKPKYYIKGLYIKLNNRSSTYKANADGGYHSNLGTYVCLGNIDQTSIKTIITQAPKVLKTMNATSPLDSSCKRTAEENQLIGDTINTETWEL